MATFTAYQSQVLREVEKTEKAIIYTKLCGFLTVPVTNIIAEGWKAENSFQITAKFVVDYIQRLKK